MKKSFNPRMYLNKLGWMHQRTYTIGGFVLFRHWLFCERTRMRLLFIQMAFWCTRHPAHRLYRLART